MSTGRTLLIIGCLVAATLATGEVRAQPRVRMPASSSTIPVTGIPVTNTAPGSSTIPVSNSSATIGQPPTFDPYSTAPSSTIPTNPAAVAPSLPGGYSTTPPPATAPYSAPSYGTTVPASTPYGSTPAPTPYGSTPAPVPGYTTVPPTGWPTTTDPALSGNPYGFPSTGYPAPYTQQPNALFPNGIAPSWDQTWPLQYAQQGPYLRLFQDVRWRQTWVSGGGAIDELGVNETEVATTMNFPNFFFSNQPLQVSPMFAIDWFNGPVAPQGAYPTDSLPPFTGPFGLPPQVYAASLSFAWQPRVTPQFWGDLEATVGVFTDFQGFTTDSVRLMGTALGVVQLTPTTTLKLGVTYLDRVDLKLLPAVGILWIPNPRSRWDLYFPRPKISTFLTTFGTTDLWAYLAAEYGGGSWTIGEQALDRRVDINQINVGGGFEWTSPTGMRAFIEAMYVFNRELVFAASLPTAPGTVPLDDAIMVRGGLAY